MGRENLDIDLHEALDTIENEMLALDLELDHSELLLKIYELPDDKISEMAQRYLPLKISNSLDKSGRALVHDALMNVKGFVSDIDKARLKTNVKAQTWIKINNGEAKRLTRLLEPIKDHLQTERDAHDKEVEAIKAEKQRVIDLRNQGRLDALLNVDTTISLAEVVLMSDETFNAYLAMATRAYNERKAIEEKEAADLKAKIEAEQVEKARLETLEAERLAKVRTEQEAEAKRLNEVALAQKKQADDLKAQQEQINKAQAQFEAREQKAKADKEAEAEAKVKAEQLKLDAEKRKAEIEAARPDSEKLIRFANEIGKLVLPVMDTTRGGFARTKISDQLDALAKFIENLSTQLVGGK